MTCQVLTARASVSTRTVTPGVSPRLLTEVPRFFSGSLITMLRELLQNAFRAGATRVSIIADSGQRMLTVTDNGCGIGDPSLVVEAGSTGWDESQVVEPAGLGMFSLLAASVQKVIVASWNEKDKPRGWRMTLTRDHLRGVPVTIEELVEPPAQSGTTVAVVFTNHTLGSPDHDQKLSSDDTGLLETVQKARSLYPFAVEFNRDGEIYAVAPYRSWEPEVTVSVSGIGVLEWRHGRDRADCREVVWAHQVIHARAFDSALGKAADALPAFAMFRYASFRWIIDPACSVRPKLPDRSDLVDDVHLAQAAHALAKSFAGHMLDVAREALAHVPGPIEVKWFTHDDRETLALPSWLRTDSDLLVRVLAFLGWAESKTHHYDQYAFGWNEDDDFQVDRSDTRRYYRTLPTSPSKAVAFTLTQMGRPTCWVAPDSTIAAREQLTIIGLKVHSSSPQVALCKKIVAQGIGELPYLFSEEGFGEDEDGITIQFQEKLGQGKHAYTVTRYPCILFAGTAAQFVQFALKSQDWLIPFVAVAQDARDSIYDYDWMRNDEFQPDTVLRDLLTEVAAFDPDLVRLHRAYYDAEDAIKAVQEIHSHALQLGRIVKTSPRLRSALGCSGRELETRCNRLLVELERARADLGKNMISNVSRENNGIQRNSRNHHS